MYIEDYSSNSIKNKEENKEENKVPDISESKKEIKKVVTNKVITKKKNKFLDVFFEETIDNVFKYVFMDVVIPSIKKGIYESITNGLDMLLSGKDGKSYKHNKVNSISYRDYYEHPRVTPSERSSNTKIYSYEDIILETRSEAEEVLNAMDDILEKYHVISISDLYELVGITGDYTDNKYGWTNLHNAEVVRVRDGYALRLPKAVPI